MTRLEINLIADIKEHMAVKYPNGQLSTVLKKIGEEFGELAEAIIKSDDFSIIEEASDLAILSWDILMKCGQTQPMQAMSIKMDVLEGRSPYRGRSAEQVNRV